VLGSVSGWFWEHGGWEALVVFCVVLLMLALVAAQVLRRGADDTRPYGRFGPQPARGE
jgi:YNFM family putative membrane transporter